MQTCSYSTVQCNIRLVVIHCHKAFMWFTAIRPARGTSYVKQETFPELLKSFHGPSQIRIFSYGHLSFRREPFVNP